MAEKILHIVIFASALYVTASTPVNFDNIQEQAYGIKLDDQLLLNYQPRRENAIPLVEAVIMPLNDSSENQNDEMLKTASAMVFNPYFTYKKRSIPRRRSHRPVRRMVYYPFYTSPYRRNLKTEDEFPLIA